MTIQYTYICQLAYRLKLNVAHLHSQYIYTSYYIKALVSNEAIILELNIITA